MTAPHEETLRIWAMEPAERAAYLDAKGWPREPEPELGESYCPGPGVPGEFCDRQEGHLGGHSTKY